MKQRVKQMEAEAAALRQMQAAAENEKVANESQDAGAEMETEEDRAAADGRSIYVGNVRMSPPASETM